MRALWLMLLALLVAPGLAAAQNVTLICDRPIVGLGGRATVQIVVQGGTNIVSNPSFPRSDGFTLTFAGESSAFQMGRGSVSQSMTYSYQLSPKTVGEWSIGPATVTMGGKKISSNALDLKVVKGSTKSAPNGAKGSVDAGIPENAQHYARASVSNATPYVGEAFTWSLEVGSSGRVRQPTVRAMPDFGGLSSEPGIDAEWTNTRVMRDGRRVEVFTAAIPVFAVEEGATEVGVAAVSLPEVMGGSGLFARVRDLSLETRPVPVAVRPLPADRPADFGRAVGQFKLFSGLDSNTIAAGETVTLTLRLEGIGALRAPEVDVKVPQGLRVYDEDPTTQVALVDGEIHSRAVFRKALVPLKPGVLEIPPVRFTFFNPATERYETALGGKLRLKVTGEAVAEPAVARSEGMAASKEEIEILASDILPLRTGDRLLGRDGLSPTHPLILALLLLPLLSFGGLATLEARSRTAGSDRGRQAARNREAKAALSAAAAAGSAGDVQGSEAALRDWLTARMERSGASLSPGEATEALVGAGAPRELAERLTGLLARAEGVRYGGESAGSLAADIAQWVADAAGEWR